MDKNAKRKIKDSVFTNLFSEPAYTFALYKTLHPEDLTATVDDIKDVTINNVLVDGIYNDLGFRVADRLMILVEAQSKWSANIIIRALMYLVQTYQDYVNTYQLDLYGTKRIHIPKAELYVIYTGDREGKPSELHLSDEFFGGEKTSVEVDVKILFGENEGDIVWQYVAFCKIFDEARKTMGPTAEAIVKTIEICKAGSILPEYLVEHEKEVRDIMFTLYDEETIKRNHEATIIRESEARGEFSARVTMVRNMIQNGATVEFASECSGLSAEQIMEFIRRK